MKTPFRLRCLAAAAALAIVSSGCLEWDSQVLTFRYDRKSDTLLIFQDYRGIYGADNKGGLTGSELGQLDSVLKGGRTFFFSNWILELNLQKLPDMIADLREQTADRVTRHELNQRGLSLLELLRKNCRIQNGDFYLDDKQRISGVQRVRITKVSELLKSLEATLHALIRDEAAKNPDDSNLPYFLNQVSEEGWKFVRFEGNQLIVRAPISKADYEKKFRGENSREETANFEKAGLQFEHRNDVLTIRVGNPKDRFTRVDVDTFTIPYRDNFRAHLPKGTAVKKKYDANAAARKFVLENE